MLKTLSIVIPVYNEEKRLSITLKNLKEDSLFLYGFKLREIIFVNDGSEDNSKVKIQKSKLELQKATGAKVKIISYQINRGKGYAVKRGMLASTSDYSLLSDADFSTPLSEIKKFTTLVKRGAKVVIGTRKNGKSTVKVAQPIHRQLLGHVFTYISKITLGSSVTDFTCGFKLFEKSAKQVIFSKARIERWGYDAEIIFLAEKFGYKVEEKAVVWRNEKGSRVNVLRDGLISFVELIKIRVNDFSNIYGKKKPELSYI